MPSEYYDYADRVPDSEILRGNSDLLKHDNLYRTVRKYSYAYIVEEANTRQIGSSISEQTLRSRMSAATEHIAERDGRGIRDVTQELRHERESNGLINRRRSSSKITGLRDDSIALAVQPSESITARGRSASDAGMSHRSTVGCVEDQRGSSAALNGMFASVSHRRELQHIGSRPQDRHTVERDVPSHLETTAVSVRKQEQDPSHAASMSLESPLGNHMPDDRLTFKETTNGP